MYKAVTEEPAVSVNHKQSCLINQKSEILCAFRIHNMNLTLQDDDLAMLLKSTILNLKYKIDSFSLSLCIINTPAVLTMFCL